MAVPFQTNEQFQPPAGMVNVGGGNWLPSGYGFRPLSLPRMDDPGGGFALNTVKGRRFSVQGYYGQGGAGTNPLEGRWYQGKYISGDPNAAYLLGADYTGIGQHDLAARMQRQKAAAMAPLSPQDALRQSYADAYNEARAANEQRYADILGLYGQRFDRGMGYLDAMGQSQRESIREQAARSAAAARQWATQHGLTGTTILPTLLRGGERDRQRAEMELSEALARNRLATDAALSGDTLQFMERRQDTYPDLNQLIQLEAAMGGGSTAGLYGGGAMMPVLAGGAYGGAAGGYGLPGGGYFGRVAGGNMLTPRQQAARATVMKRAAAEQALKQQRQREAADRSQLARYAGRASLAERGGYQAVLAELARQRAANQRLYNQQVAQRIRAAEARPGQMARQQAELPLYPPGYPAELGFGPGYPAWMLDSSVEVPVSPQYRNWYSGRP